MTSVFDPAPTATASGVEGSNPYSAPLQASLDFESLLDLPTSPVGSTGDYTSETSSISNRVHSPATSAVSGGGGSVSDHPGGAESPSHSPLVTSTFPDPSQWSPNIAPAAQDTQDPALKRLSGSEFSSSSNNDIRIDVGRL